jgi:putative membrane protein
MEDMVGFLGEGYLWVKAFHIIFVIFWMAGMFMMPRYFAYHSQYDVGSAEDAAWIEREAKLMKIIINPAITLAWVFGIMLVLNIGLDAGGWLHAKLAIVFLFSGLHGSFSKWRKEFARGERKRSEKFYRKINETPAFVIIAVVILVIVRPF